MGFVSRSDPCHGVVSFHVRMLCNVMAPHKLQLERPHTKHSALLSTLSFSLHETKLRPHFTVRTRALLCLHSHIRASQIYQEAATGLKSEDHFYLFFLIFQRVFLLSLSSLITLSLTTRSGLTEYNREISTSLSLSLLFRVILGTARGRGRIS
ncbi:hypothetical protein VNO77_40994 [Canavalia gladiata]|uniref:Uncharacterized protein n=1 Tax=Canavalia gladiata TaxID=3824 RepID=A0AAN9PPW3_CANGL